MKKIILVVMILSLFIGVLQSVVLRQLYLQYLAEPCETKFFITYARYTYLLASDTLEVTTADHFYIMNMHRLETNRIMAHLIENIDDLAPGMKRGVADALLAMGRTKESIEIYEKVVIASPAWSCAWRHKGEAHFRNNDLPNAERSLRLAIQHRETHYDAYLMLAEVLYEQGKHRDALQTIEQAFNFLDYADVCEDELYSDKETQFLYLKILQANRNRRNDARTLEAELRKRYPEDKFWR